MEYKSKVKSCLPKYQQVRSFFLEELSAGKFEAGARFYSENAIAARFQISPITVSKAINFLVEEGYVRREQGVGSFVVKVPEKPKQIKVIEHKAIGILTGGIDLENNVALGKLLLNLHKVIFEKGYMIYLAHNSPEQLIEGQVDGIIAIGFFERKKILTLKKSGIPVVGCGGALIHDFPSVLSDAAATAFKVCEYLWKLNHKKIMLLGSGTDARLVFQRMQPGIRRFLSKHGLLSSTISEAVKTEQDDYAFLKKALKSAARPDALFLMNYLSISPMFRALDESGLRIPDDISVIVNGINTLSFPANPPLSAVFAEVKCMCRNLTDMLLTMMRGEPLPVGGNLIEDTFYETKSCIVRKK